MHLVLIRHGETALNVARVIQPANTDLNARGRAQAQCVARHVTTLGVLAVVSSDLPRALQTARCVAQASGAPMHTTALLQERNFGDWRGRSHADLPEGGLDMLAAPPGGESWEAFEQRVARAFDDALQRQAACAGTLAVVTHGLVIRAMLARHVVLPGGACAPDHLGNASVCVIQAGPPHRALRVNSTEHLDEDLRDHPKGLSGG